jgi:hypothetical protein
MLEPALSVIALLAGGLILEVYAAARVSLSYQDERGFHPGTEAPPCGEACPSVKPS